MAMAHEKLTQVQTIVFTLYEGYDAGAQSLRWTQISSWPAEPNPAQPNPAEPNPAEPNPAQPKPRAHVF